MHNPHDSCTDHEPVSERTRRGRTFCISDRFAHFRFLIRRSLPSLSHLSQASPQAKHRIQRYLFCQWISSNPRAIVERLADTDERYIDFNMNDGSWVWAADGEEEARYCPTKKQRDFYHNRLDREGRKRKRRQGERCPKRRERNRRQWCALPHRLR